MSLSPSQGNLDVQYLMGTCTASPTTWWYTDDQSFADFFVAVYNTPSPPKVLHLHTATPLPMRYDG